MRFLKPLLTALVALLAIIGGLVVSLLVAVTTAGVFAARRALRLRGSTRAGAPAPTRTRSASREDAIDVVATEVPLDSARH